MIFPNQILMISLAIGLTAGVIVILIRKWVHVNILKGHHVVGIPIFLQMGVIYGVFLAFIFSIVWENFSIAAKEVELEANSVKTLIQLAPGFPATMHKEIRDQSLNYIQRVMHYEWPKMQHKKVDLPSRQILDQLQQVYLNFSPQNSKESIIYSLSLQHLADLREHRRMRIFRATESNFSPLLEMLIITGIVVVSISFLFGMPNMWIQALLCACFTAFIASILLMIIFLHQPFAGNRLSITPYNYEQVAEMFQ